MWQCHQNPLELSDTPWDRALHTADPVSALLAAGVAGNAVGAGDKEHLVAVEADDGDGGSGGGDHTPGNWRIRI